MGHPRAREPSLPVFLQQVRGLAARQSVQVWQRDCQRCPGYGRQPSLPFGSGVELHLLVELQQQMTVQTAGYRMMPSCLFEMKNHKQPSFTFLEGQRLRAYADKDYCLLTRCNQWPLVF